MEHSETFLPHTQSMLPKYARQNLFWVWTTFLPQTHSIASLGMLTRSFLSLRNFPSLNIKYCFPKSLRWNLFEFSFPTLKAMLPQTCWIEQTYLSLINFNFPSLNSQYCLPKCARWNLFEFEKLSFPTLKVMLPQIC